jgi:glycosyltransferase involved in cell wall biosynthesis
MVSVSIIVPIYNVEKYLRQCLDSIVQQTKTDIEIICVNDGSTDSCPQILAEYAKKDNRIRVIHQQNG